jgi:hypothetical protein
MLRIDGVSIGENFMNAIGEGFIRAEAELLAQAKGVADAIERIFQEREAARRASQGSGNQGISGSSAFEPAFNFEPSSTAETAPVTVNQYFYGVKEEKTAFETYRATGKALEVAF